MRAGKAPDANDANKKARQGSWVRWNISWEKIVLCSSVKGRFTPSYTIELLTIL